MQMTVRCREGAWPGGRRQCWGGVQERFQDPKNYPQASSSTLFPSLLLGLPEAPAGAPVTASWPFPVL